jgi:hypothetical protein
MDQDRVRGQMGGVEFRDGGDRPRIDERFRSGLAWFPPSSAATVKP